MSRAPAISEGRSRTDDDDDNGRSKSGKGGQRTVCVRLCDGYYWPVSFQTKRSQFQKDARACESSCTGEARLFHYPSFGEIHDAVDIQANLTPDCRRRSSIGKSSWPVVPAALKLGRALRSAATRFTPWKRRKKKPESLKKKRLMMPAWLSLKPKRPRPNCD